MTVQAGVIAALWFTSLVNYLERVTISFAGPAIMKSLSLSPGAFGLVLSCFGLGYLIAQLPGGMLGDRFGARAMLVGGPLLWAAFTGLTGLAATVAGLLAARICLGFAEGLSTSSLYKVIGDNFAPKQRSRALAISFTAVPLGLTFAGLLVGKLTGALGWRAMFFLMMVPALLAAAAGLALLPRDRGRDLRPAAVPDEQRTSFGDVIGTPSLWLLALANFAWNVPYWGYIGWMPTYLALGRHIDLKALGPLAGLSYLFGFFGLLLGGWLGTLWHNRCLPIIIAFFAAAALGLGLAYRAESFAVALGGLSIAAFFLLGASGPVARVVLTFAPEQRRATFMGIFSTAGQLGGAAAPAAIGFLVVATGSFAAGFTLMIVAFLVAAACLAALAPRAAELRVLLPATS